MARLLMFCAALFSAAIASAQSLLPPELAFRVLTRQTGADAVEFQYQMAPGYILYKDRFLAEAAGRRLEIELPPALNREDRATHHQIGYYRDVVTMRVKFPSGSQRLTGITVTAQGCAVEIGICYPPMRITWFPQADFDVEASMTVHRNACMPGIHC